MKAVMSRIQEPESSFCVSFQTAIELIGKRWNGAILAVLLDGPRRFSELVVTVPGLSERLLAERLRELEGKGILIRRVLPGPPLGVEYELTAAGRELAPAVEVVTAWARKWLDASPESGPPGVEASREARRARPATV
jgi:DNA-binding HxlR family transcriptional regulator